MLYHSLKTTMLAGTSALVLAGCAAQTPAPVVGRYEREQGVTPMASGERLTDRVSARASGTGSDYTAGLTRQPSVQSEDLSAIEPAAGHMQVASLPPARTATPQTPAQALAATPAVEMQTYTVKAGDTIYSLSRRFNTTPAAIREANKMDASAMLETGMLVMIPGGSGRLPESADKLGNGLPFGATLSASAPVDAAKPAASQVVDPYTVEPAAGPAEPKKGDVLKGPSGQRYRMLNENKALAPAVETAAAVPAVQTHTVQPGETIYRIAKMYDSSVIDIMAANDFSQPQDLKSGTQVKVPTQAKASVAVAAASTPAAPAAGTGGRPASESALDETRRLMRGDEEAAATKPQAEAAPAAEPAQEVAVAEEVVVRKVAEVAEAPKNSVKRGTIDSTAARTRGLAWPVNTGDVVKKFGEAGNGVSNTGINIVVPANTPVVAADAGKVLYADSGLKAYGRLVLIRHDNGMVTAYAHNNSLLVDKGDTVKKGQVVALSGNSGNVDKPQLHFEIRRNAQAVDPLRVLPQRSQMASVN